MDVFLGFEGDFLFVGSSVEITHTESSNAIRSFVLIDLDRCEIKFKRMNPRPKSNKTISVQRITAARANIFDYFTCRVAKRKFSLKVTKITELVC